MQQRCEAGSLSHPQPEKVAGGMRTAVQSTISRFPRQGRMRTWKRWQGGRLEGGLDWTGGGQWDESKPPRSVRLCLAFGMIQWDQGSECDGRARGMIGAGCGRSEAIKSDARMLVDGLGITNTLPRRYSARLPPPRSHYARLALVRHGPCKEAGLSSILPYLWSACRGAHRGGPSPSAEPPSQPKPIFAHPCLVLHFFCPRPRQSCCVPAPAALSAGSPRLPECGLARPDFVLALFT